MQDVKTLKVKKRDGQLEPFSHTKVIGSLILAGATPEQAKRLTGQIEIWAGQEAHDGVIETIKIREKILELLKPINVNAAVSFDVYKKSSVDN
jgi:transcriptional regulator NrdR family protein